MDGKDYGARVASLIGQCTTTYRMGEEVVQRGHVTEVFGYPCVEQASEHEEIFDLHFIAVGVDKNKALELEGEFKRVMDSYPDPDRLRQGPNYIEIGATVGDQENGMRLFALGECLGYWKIITPKDMRLEGEEADELAGRGFVMISGYQGKRLVEVAACD